MDANLGQFHKGPHNIRDPKDPDGEFHPSYDTELKRLLTDLDNLIDDWAKACFICKNKGDGKLEPTWQTNEMLDRLSHAVIRDLKGPRCNWYYFISRIALDYHMPVCRHTKDKL